MVINKMDVNEKVWTNMDLNKHAILQNFTLNDTIWYKGTYSIVVLHFTVIVGSSAISLPHTLKWI